jgi:hypothetical protein
VSYSSNSSSDFIDISILFVIGPERSRNMWQVDYVGIPQRDVFGMERAEEMSGLMERLCFVQFDVAFGAAVVAAC